MIGCFAPSLPRLHLCEGATFAEDYLRETQKENCKPKRRRKTLIPVRGDVKTDGSYCRERRVLKAICVRERRVLSFCSYYGERRVLRLFA